IRFPKLYLGFAFVPSRLHPSAESSLVMVLQYLNHAAPVAQHMIAIKKGKAEAVGTPTEVMSPDVLREVFGIEADIVTDPRTGVPLCLPYALAGQPAVSQAVKGLKLEENQLVGSVSERREARPQVAARG
ncbi:ABC transporter ATP-binding protein, partial [Paenibacillus sp. 28ISP30-2]|nr:ABC transporter ATP-binding protein [Paenibacillus sp. 28ISP30-2]